MVMRIKIRVALLCRLFACLPGIIFFGYIGQCQTILWNGSGRYMLGMEIDRIDHAPWWKRTNNAILVPGIADSGTRQMFCIRGGILKEVGSTADS